MGQPPLRVLLADDEVSLREPLAKQLHEAHGYQVDTAADGQELLTRLEQSKGRYDVALIDNLLVPVPGQAPEPLGVALTKEIKARYTGIEVIVFTGWGMTSQTGLEALRAGAYRYLSKPFNSDELGMLIQMAAEHSQLKNMAREKQLLEQLMKTSAALLNGSGLPEVLDTILQGVQAIGFDRIRLYLLAEERQVMIGHAQVGMDKEFVGFEFPAADNIHVQLLLSDPRPQVFVRMNDELWPYEGQLAKDGVNQWLGVPLLLQGKFIGMLSADNKFSQRPISEAELEPVALFAAQAAAAIENARLRNQEREATQKVAQRAHQLEVLHQINAHISSALNLEGILQVTLNEGLRAIRAYEGSIMLVNPITNELEIKAWIVQGEFVAGKPHRKLGPGEGIAGHVAATGQVYNCTDITKDTHFVESFTGRNFHSLLSVPIASRGRVLGTINADSREPCFFKEEDVQFLSALADHVAIALEAQRLRDLGTVLPTLTMDKMLSKIVESACVLIGTEFGDIFLIHKESGDVIRAAKFPALREINDGPRKKVGLTAEIINSGEPIVVGDAQQDPRVRQSTKDRGIKSLMGVPLKVRVEHPDAPQVTTIGVLFVDAMQQREFSSRDVELLQSLANQAAITIEKTRLYEEVARERDRSEWLAAQLLALAEITKEIQAELDLPNLLNLISRLAAELLVADAGGILLLDEARQHLTFKGAYGLSQKAVEGTRDVVGDSIAGRVVKSGMPIIAHDIPNDTRFYNPAADEEGWLAIMSTPLRVGGKIIGTLDVHSKRDRHAFDEDDLQILSLMANQAAIAIENVRLFQQTSHRALALEALHRTSLDITSRREMKELVSSILERAVELLQAKGGGLYLLNESGHQVKVAAVSNLPEFLVGMSLEVERGIIGYVIKNRATQFVPDYRSWPQRLPQYDAYGFTAVAGTPITRQDKIWGVLAVHDIVEGRIFDQEDLNLLSHFGNLAAVALENAELAARDADKLRRLEQLAQANSEIMGNLGTMSLDERLNLIARHATEILEAEACGIFLVKQPRVLSLEAGFGHREDSFTKGRPYTIESGPQTGLTGHIAHEGELFNLYGDNLANHVAVKGEPNHAVSGHCYSLLAIPLKKRVGLEEKLIGLLRVDNKKDRNGHAEPTVGFTQEDEWILRLFAGAALVAIEGAELVAQLNEQKDHWARLVASSPNGIIALDHHGHITDFNEQAQNILKYQPAEVLGKVVNFLYEDPQESHRVGALLHAAPDGKLANHETFIRSRVGERIPIRLAATWLYDAQGNQTGSVGYFEDLRSIKAVERRLELLLKASNTVAQAENLTDGLQSLAEMIVIFLDVSFCRSFLLDESQQALLAKAVYPPPLLTDWLDWNPRSEEILIVDQWPEIAEVLTTGTSNLLRIDHPQHQPFLPERSARLGLKNDIQSLLLIPLKARDKVVGLLALAEMRPWAQAPFSKQKQDLAVAIADQTAMLIDRMHLFEVTERHRQLLLALERASRHIRAEKETLKLVQEIVRLTAELVGCTVGGLYINHPQLKELELYVTYELPPELIGNRLFYGEGLVGLVAQTGQPQIVYNYSNWPDHEKILEAYYLETVVGIPLKQAGEIEAVLFVADQTGLRQLAQTDLEILESFAVQASIALQTSRLLSHEQRMFRPLAILHKVSDYIQAARDLNKIVHVVLTGITAGYGLGFNRAGLLLLDEQRENLIGCMGIGHLDKAATLEDWAIHNRLGREDFKQYLELLEQDALPPTPIGQRIKGLQLSLNVAEPNVFWQVVLAGHYTLFTQDELDKLPDNFIEAFEPALPLIVVPLLARDQVIGLLVADNKFTRGSITPQDVDSLLTFANTAAVTIDNIRLFRAIEAAQERLRSFYEASNTLASSRPEQVLHDIVEQARVAANASGVSIFLIDQMGQARYLITVGADKPIDLKELIRPNGLSIQVMRTGRPEVIEDTNRERERVNPSMFWRDVAAALCLPVSVEGKRIGVMWLHFDQPHHFYETEIEALQLYVNQAAIAYDSARRMEELEHMRQAAEALAGAAEPIEVLRQIAQNACQVLKADSASVSSYDAVQGKFTLKGSVAAGIPSGRWRPYCPDGFWYSQTDAKVMEQGWVGVENARDEQHNSFLEARTQQFLQEIEVQSFQGITLTVAEEKLGVLYVNYHRPRSFSQDEQKTAQTFANHAALALKKAKLLDQVNKAHAAARVVAEVMALGNLQSTLDSIVSGTRDVLGCDAVTLYTYDEHQEKFGFPPAMAGVKHPEKVLELGRVDEQSVIHNVLALNDLYETESAMTDPLMHGPFVVREEIVSSVGIPLITRRRKVGVMFINYRRPHRFTDDELINVELFANQAAVAIRNAQLYEQVQSRARLLDAAARVAREATATLEISELLNETARLICERFDFYHCGIFLLDNERKYAVLQATYPQTGYNMLKIGHKLEVGRQGIVGFVTKAGKYHLAPKVAEDPYHLFNPELPLTHAEMTFPFIARGQVIGALDVQSTELVNLREEDITTLQTMADQLANAIHNAQQYEELKHTKGLVGSRTALAWMGMATSSWRHAIDKHALTIREQVQLLFRNLDQLKPSEQASQLSERLSTIERLANKILEKPLTPPLTAEEGVESVSINDLISERARQLWQNEPYKTARLQVDLQLSAAATVKISREWLRRAFDILVDNAVDAVKEREVREVVIGTRAANEGVEVFVSDTGAGLPREVQEKIGLEVIEKPDDARGLGMGLLMAQTIVQTYGGVLRVSSTGSTGTVMAIWLPLERIGV